VRVVTWNVNSLKARLGRVQRWIEAFSPDVVCLQETKLADDAFPALTFQSLGYDCFHNGEGRWNGVAVLSRVGLADPVAGFGDGIEPDPDARLAWATCAGVRVASCYVPNGRAVGHDHYHYKLAWFGWLRAHLEAVCDPAGEVVVAGDFNVAPEDRDVWDIGVFSEATHVTEPERAAWRAVCDWGLADVFRRRYPGVDGLYTFWDYQAGRFHKRQGMRIDHVLATESLAARAGGIVVDRNARKGSKPSDHAPLVVDFDL